MPDKEVQRHLWKKDNKDYINKAGPIIISMTATRNVKKYY